MLGSVYIMSLDMDTTQFLKFKQRYLSEISGKASL